MYQISAWYKYIWGHAVAQLVEALRCQSVAGSIPDDVTGIFH